MKRIISVLLAFLLTFSSMLALVSCGDDDSSSSTVDPKSSGTAASTTELTTAPTDPAKPSLAQMNEKEAFAYILSGGWTENTKSVNEYLGTDSIKMVTDSVSGLSAEAKFNIDELSVQDNALIDSPVSVTANLDTSKKGMIFKGVLNALEETLSAEIFAKTKSGNDLDIDLSLLLKDGNAAKLFEDITFFAKLDGLNDKYLSFDKLIAGLITKATEDTDTDYSETDISSDISGMSISGILTIVKKLPQIIEILKPCFIDPAEIINFGEAKSVKSDYTSDIYSVSGSTKYTLTYSEQALREAVVFLLDKLIASEDEDISKFAQGLKDDMSIEAEDFTSLTLTIYVKDEVPFYAGISVLVPSPEGYTQAEYQPLDASVLFYENDKGEYVCNITGKLVSVEEEYTWVDDDTSWNVDTDDAAQLLAEDDLAIMPAPTGEDIVTESSAPSGDTDTDATFTVNEYSFVYSFVITPNENGAKVSTVCSITLPSNENAAISFDKITCSAESDVKVIDGKYTEDKKYKLQFVTDGITIEIPLESKFVISDKEFSLTFNIDASVANAFSLKANASVSLKVQDNPSLTFPTLDSANSIDITEDNVTVLIGGLYSMFVKKCPNISAAITALIGGAGDSEF